MSEGIPHPPAGEKGGGCPPGVEMGRERLRAGWNARSHLGRPGAALLMGDPAASRGAAPGWGGLLLCLEWLRLDFERPCAAAG